MRLLLLLLVTCLGLGWLVFDEGPAPQPVLEPRLASPGTAPQGEPARLEALALPAERRATQPEQGTAPLASAESEPAANETGAVRARFLLPLEFEQMPLRLLVRWPSEDWGWRRAESRIPELAPDGSFEVEGIGAGPVRVVAQRMRHLWADVLTKVEGQVVAGETLDLGVIDLRTRVWNVNIRVLDPAGQPVPGSAGTHNAPDNEDIEIVDGAATVTVSRQEDVAWFGAPGYQATRVDDLLDGMTVTLEPAPRLELVLSNPGALPPDPWQLEVQVQPPPEDPKWAHMLNLASASLIEDDVVVAGAVTEIPVHQPGARLGVRWRLVDRTSRLDPPVVVLALGIVQPTQITVGEGGARHVFTLDPEAVEAIVAKGEAERRQREEARRRKEEERAEEGEE